MLNRSKIINVLALIGIPKAAFAHGDLVAGVVYLLFFYLIIPLWLFRIGKKTANYYNVKGATRFAFYMFPALGYLGLFFVWLMFTSR